jgi:SulP family sulfate permease
VGIALAALLYISRIAQTTTVAPVTPEYIEEGRMHVLQDKVVPPYVSILRIHGPFLFGTTDKLEDTTADLNQLAPVVILRLRNMTALDATGLHAMEKLAERLRKSGRTLLLCGARQQPGYLLEKGEFVEHVGRDNILPNVSAALDRARQINSSFAGLGDEVAADMRDQLL